MDTHAPNVPTLVHCFTDGIEELEALLERGYFVGITGWIADTRRNQDHLAAIPSLPLERMLIETDAPWLTPRNIPKFRKIKANEPKYLSYVVEAPLRPPVMEWRILSTTVHRMLANFLAGDTPSCHTIRLFILLVLLSAHRDASLGGLAIQ